MQNNESFKVSQGNRRYLMHLCSYWPNYLSPLPFVIKMIHQLGMKVFHAQVSIHYHFNLILDEFSSIGKSHTNGRSVVKPW
jgi:hypothetical protein